VEELVDREALLRGEVAELQDPSGVRLPLVDAQLPGARLARRGEDHGLGEAGQHVATALADDVVVDPRQGVEGGPRREGEQLPVDHLDVGPPGWGNQVPGLGDVHEERAGGQLRCAQGVPRRGGTGEQPALRQDRGARAGLDARPASEVARHGGGDGLEGEVHRSSLLAQAGREAEGHGAGRAEDPHRLLLG